MEQPEVALFLFVAAIALLVAIAAPIILIIRSTSSYKKARETASATEEHAGKVRADYLCAGFEVKKTFWGPMSVKGVHAGAKFTYKIMPGSRNSPPTAVVAVTSPLLGDFAVTRERAADTFFRRIGYANEVQTGDAAFDGEFFLDGASRDYVRAVFSDARNRDVVRTLFGLGFDSVELSGGQASASKSVGPYLLDLPVLTGAVERLAGLRATLGTGVVAMYGGISTKQIKSACIALVIVATALYLWVAVGTRPLVEGWWGAAQREWQTVAMACIAFVAMAAVSLRGRAAAHRELAVVIFLALPALVIGGGSAVVLANQQFDESTLRTHEARLRQKYVTSGKSAQYYHLEVESWRQDLSYVRMEVPYGIYKTLKPGQTVIVGTRTGRLGIEWIDTVDAAAP